LKTVKDACKPHPSVFEDDPLDNIDDLARAFAEGREAEEFFERSHLTSGMRDLFDLGLRRLAGRSDQAVFELTQAMGGGKTHALVAFGTRVERIQDRAHERRAEVAAVELGGGLQPRIIGARPSHEAPWRCRRRSGTGP